MILLFLLYQILSVQSSVPTSTGNDPVVQTPLGAIRGVRREYGNYFMGVPYAKVNSSNVLGSSIPNPRFNGIFDASDDSVACPQYVASTNSVIGTLDCLILNIYVPHTANNGRQLPVMVYFHGGGFNGGSAKPSELGPEFLIKHDVILIVVNYRLNVYGFLCLDIPDIPGNQGLKDQTSALRWIKDNIASFGGDPKKVTIFGTSAGGMSVGFHLMSDAEILYSNAIMQSGSPFITLIVTNPANHGVLFTIAAALGLQTQNVNEAIAYISNSDPHTVVRLSQNIPMSTNPCVERQFPRVERFLSTRPIHSNFSKAADIPIMVGYNFDEFSFMIPPTNNPLVIASWNLFFPGFLSTNFNFPLSKIAQYEPILRRFYIGDENIGNAVRPQLSKFNSDILIVYPIIRGIKYYLDAGAKKVYQYMFKYDGERNYIKIRDNVTDPGATHGDEIAYLFTMDILPDKPTPEDQLAIDRMTTMWTNFAKTGDPTPSVTNTLPVKWEPITSPSQYNYLVIDSTLSTGRRYEHRRMTFLDLFYTANREYEVGFEVPNDKEDESEEDNGDDEEENGEETAPNSAVSAYLSSFFLLFIVFNLF